MKKTMLALAALAAMSGSALAQSSVTLYGVVDVSLENVKGTSSVSRVSSDNLASSRLGFRGVEDLGGGMKAKFMLETAVKADTGANGGGTARFFDRAAWLGLESSLGELRLGRIDSSIGFLSGNTSILGAQTYDDLKIAKMYGADTYRRLDNAITYLTPNYAGFTAQVQYSLATNGTETDKSTAPANAVAGTGKAFGLNAQYAAGPLGLGLGYINAKNNAAGTGKDTGALFYGSYDFGAAKLIAYYDQDKITGDNDKRSVLGLKVAVPVTKDFGLTAGFSKVKNAGFTKDADATIISVKGTYSLSKRTALYALLTSVDNDNKAALSVDGVAITAGKRSHGVAFGVRHSF